MDTVPVPRELWERIVQALAFYSDESLWLPPDLNGSRCGADIWGLRKVNGEPWRAAPYDECMEIDRTLPHPP